MEEEEGDQDKLTEVKTISDVVFACSLLLFLSPLFLALFSFLPCGPKRGLLFLNFFSVLAIF